MPAWWAYIKITKNLIFGILIVATCKNDQKLGAFGIRIVGTCKNDQKLRTFGIRMVATCKNEQKLWTFGIRMVATYKNNQKLLTFGIRIVIGQSRLSSLVGHTDLRTCEKTFCPDYIINDMQKLVAK